MTCPDCNHPRKLLINGTETCSWSEAWRAECEARYVCALPTVHDRREYLRLVEIKRGDVYLRGLVASVWKATRPAGGGV